MKKEKRGSLLSPTSLETDSAKGRQSRPDVFYKNIVPKALQYALENTYAAVTFNKLAGLQRATL